MTSRGIAWRSPSLGIHSGHQSFSVKPAAPDWKMPRRIPPIVATHGEDRLPNRAAPRAGTTKSVYLVGVNVTKSSASMPASPVIVVEINQLTVAIRLTE